MHVSFLWWVVFLILLACADHYDLEEKQTSFSVAVGLSLMAVGVMIFVIGQFIGENKEKNSFWFWTVNVWIVILIPISCVFNAMRGFLEGIGGHLDQHQNWETL